MRGQNGRLELVGSKWEAGVGGVRMGVGMGVGMGGGGNSSIIGIFVYSSIPVRKC